MRAFVALTISRLGAANLSDKSKSTGEPSFRSISVPDELYAKLVPIAKQAEFETVDQFAAFVLAEVVAAQQQPAMSAEQEAKVSERLRNLGYM
jgi:hypothetical protein